MKKIIKWTIRIAIIICVIWGMLTFWAESEGHAYTSEIGNAQSLHKALIVYDPDPFYNLDQQVCESFAQGLQDNGWAATVASVASAKEIKDSAYNLYVFCANTYNWMPDWAVTGFIKKHASVENKNVIAITLGAGSTEHSQKAFESIIKERRARLNDSKTFWLWKPNDENRLKESNIAVVLDITRKWANEIAAQLK